MPYQILDNPTDFKLAKDTAQVQDDVNVRLTTWNEAEATHAKDAAKLSAIPMDNIPADFQKRCGELTSRRLQLLRDEQILLQGIQQFYSLADRDRRAAAHEASDQHTAAETKVHADLLKIGYVDGPLPGSAMNCIIPDMIKRHPLVYTKRNFAEALQHATYQTVFQNLDTRKEIISQELSALIKSAVKAI